MNGKLAGFEFLRFYFMIWICLIHIWTPFSISHGSIGVDFFFMSAGFFLFQHFEKDPIAVYPYAKKRFHRLYPIYIIGIILGYGLLIFDLLKDGEAVSPTMMAESFLTDSMMIQGLGWFSHPYSGNAVSWFVSVLFIASILLYAALRYNQRLTVNLLIPIFCIVYYAAHGTLAETTTLGRGLAGLSLGVLLAKISPDLRESTIRTKNALNILSVLAFVLLSLYIVWIEECFDSFAIVLFVPLIAACSIQGSLLNRLFNHRIWLFLGGITYEMLMLQIPCRFLINYGYDHFPFHRTLWIVAYLLLTILSAWLLKTVLRSITRQAVQ